MTNVTMEFNRNWLDAFASIGRLNNETVLDVHLTVLKDVHMAWVNGVVLAN